MKGVLLIIDGLGDLPVPELGGKTPLEAAHTPFLDRLAGGGRYGLVDPIGPGETPSTYSGVGTLLGVVSEEAELLGRGPVEAAGLGLRLLESDIALRANFATLQACDDGLMVVDRRAGRIREGTQDLASVLDNVDLGDGIMARFRPTHQHRGVLVLSGPSLSPRIRDTDPGDAQLPARLLTCVADVKEAELAARCVNRFVAMAHERLAGHAVNAQRKAAGLPPANGIITRGAGAVVELDNVVREAGLRACVITGCNTVRGLGNLFGFDCVADARFTGDLDTDLDAKMHVAVAQLSDHDVVFVHVKAPDICAHDRLPLAKRDFLEKVDKALAPLVAAGIVIAVAADHTTDSNSGLHTDDPVPALLHCPGTVAGKTSVKFGETACSGGNMPRQASQDFLLEIIQCLQ